MNKKKNNKWIILIVSGAVLLIILGVMLLFILFNKIRYDPETLEARRYVFDETTLEQEYGIVIGLDPSWLEKEILLEDGYIKTFIADKKDGTTLEIKIKFNKEKKAVEIVKIKNRDY